MNKVFETIPKQFNCAGFTIKVEIEDYLNGNNYGYRGGMNYYQIIELLQRYGAYNAANLDGGASTSLAVNKLLYNKPCGIGGTGERALPTAWIVK